MLYKIEFWIFSIFYNICSSQKYSIIKFQTTIENKHINFYNLIYLLNKINAEQ